MVTNWFVENSAWFVRFEEAELYLKDYLLESIAPTSNTDGMDREVGKSELGEPMPELSEREYVGLE